MMWKDHLKWGLVSVSITMLVMFAGLYLGFIDLPWAISWWIFETHELTWTDWGFAFIMGMYGSIFPDIDIETSKAFGLTVTLMIIVTIYLLLFTGMVWMIVAILILIIIIMRLKHRGIAHNILLGFGLFFVITFLFQSWLVGLLFFIGFCTHLICDWV